MFPSSSTAGRGAAFCWNIAISTLPFSFGRERRKSEDDWRDVGLVSSWRINGAGAVGAAGAADAALGIGSNFPPNGLFGAEGEGVEAKEGAAGFAGTGGGTCGTTGFITGAEGFIAEAAIG